MTNAETAGLPGKNATQLETQLQQFCAS